MIKGIRLTYWGISLVSVGWLVTLCIHDRNIIAAVIFTAIASAAGGVATAYPRSRWASVATFIVGIFIPVLITTQLQEAGVKEQAAHAIAMVPVAAIVIACDYLSHRTGSKP